MILMALIGGEASATTTTVNLENNNNPALNGLKVNVVIDDTYNNMSVQLDTLPPLLVNEPIGIDKFYYNSDMDFTLLPTGWSWKKGETADGFGPFKSGGLKDPAGTGGISSPLVFSFVDFTSPAVFDPPNPQMAIHIRFNDDCSGWISNRVHSGAFTYDDDTQISGCQTTNIPEFPTVALPIAAVIGIVLIFQHRKKKEE